MTTVFSVLGAMLLVGVLVTIHEAGHFAAARFFGVTVKVFSFGIGPRLFGFAWRGTDYRVSALPIGGYVRWVGSDPFSDSGGDDEDWIDAKGSFIHKPAWQRLIIVAAGPVTNLILPVLVFTMLFAWGEPQPESMVGRVEHRSVLEAAGVVPGDRILAVNETPVLTWVDVYDAVEEAPTRSLTLKLDRGGKVWDVTVAVDESVDLPATAGDYGMFEVAPDTSLVVDDPASPGALAGLKTGDRVMKINGAEVHDWIEFTAALEGQSAVKLEVQRASKEPEGEPNLVPITLSRSAGWNAAPEPADDVIWREWGVANAMLAVSRMPRLEDCSLSAAQRGGLQVGDRLLKVGDRDVYSFRDVIRAVQGSLEGEGAEATAREVPVRYRRNGVVAEVVLKPDVLEDVDDFGRYRTRPVLNLGSGGAWVPRSDVARPYGIPEAAVRGFETTRMLAGFMVEQLGMLVTGEASVKHSIGGPIEIFRTAKRAADEGLFTWASILAQLSISLGVINFLPIPVLDGGQLVVYGSEWVRGRPLPFRLRERLQQVGVLFLIATMLIVGVFDVQRWASARSEVPKCQE